MGNQILLNLHIVGLLVGGAALIVAGAHDILTRTVPNWLSVAIALAGIGLRCLDGTALFSLIASLLVFAGCFLLWRRGVMGGADVKLLTSLALLVPPTEVPATLMAVTITGAVLALGYIALRRIAPKPTPKRPTHLLARAMRAETWRMRRGGPLPYAVAIAFGGVLVLMQAG